MKINKPIAGTVIRNRSFHPTMTCIVIIADDESASIMGWDSKLDHKTWAEVLACSPDWELKGPDGEWHFMFPQLLRRSGMPDFYFIPDCSAEPSGSAAEWLEVIKAIDNKEHSCSFRRLGCRVTANGSIEFDCPRNRVEAYDNVLISAEDYPEWRRRALATLTGTPLA